MVAVVDFTVCHLMDIVVDRVVLIGYLVGPLFRQIGIGIIGGEIGARNGFLDSIVIAGGQLTTVLDIVVIRLEILKFLLLNLEIF